MIMKSFFAQLIKGLFIAGLVSWLLCLPLWGLAMLVLLGFGRPLDPWPYLLIAFSSIYFGSVAWTTLRVLSVVTSRLAEKLWYEVRDWLL